MQAISGHLMETLPGRPMPGRIICRPYRLYFGTEHESFSSSFCASGETFGLMRLEEEDAHVFLELHRQPGLRHSGKRRRRGGSRRSEGSCFSSEMLQPSFE
jgi:hypothetical protein